MEVSNVEALVLQSTCSSFRTCRGFIIVVSISVDSGLLL